MLPVIALALVSGLAVVRMGGNANRKAKEKALSLLQCWAEGISREMRISRELVDQFNEEQVTNLFGDQEIRLYGEEQTLTAHANLVLACNGINVKEQTRFSDHLNIDGDIWVVPQGMSIAINAHLAAYLNLTEVILAAADHRIADPTIIYSELTPVVMRASSVQSPNGRFCHVYRRASGGAFPAIDRFVQGLESGASPEPALMDRCKRFFWY